MTYTEYALPMAISDQDLYALLVENEFIEKNKLAEAFSIAKANSIPLYKSIVQKDLLSDENMGKLIADHLKLPYINLTKVSIQKDILHIVPEILAREKRVIVFSLENGIVKIATDTPGNTQLYIHIGKKTNAKPQIYFATEKNISDTLSRYKKEFQRTFNDLLHEQVVEAGQSGSEAPIIKIVDTLIEYAFTSKASDIHIEPKKDHALVRFRVDGVLEDIVTFSFEIHKQIITRIKVMSRLRTDEHLSSQDGKMQIALEQEDLDIRVSLVPIVGGEKAVLRLLSSSSRQFGLSDLGMTDADLAKVKNAAAKPYGMILSTGPTGSGKSTSMYAILKILNTREKNIATIEDPVEYQIQDINQIQVNPKTNLTFAEGLRSILRQDPDIVYVGEIRDEETADIAINSAMTGHLVLSTLHTNDAATSLPRLMDMNVEPFLVASTVNVIVAQRLVRAICEKCKVSFTKKTAELEEHFKSTEIQKAFGSEKELRMYHGKGCAVCRNTGYSGRVGIFEVMVISDGIRELITQKANARDITKKAVEEGMNTMIDDGLGKVQQGITTIDEVLRVTKEET